MNIAKSFALFFLLSVPAFADTMTATQPGLMCTSAAALAVLTLPDGSDRTESTLARPGDAALKTKGGCIDIPHGAQVDVQRRRRNTSIVTFDAGRGPQTFYVPNIDFTLETAGTAHMSACLPYDKPVKIIGTVTIGKVYAENNYGKVGWLSWQQIKLATPICTIANEAEEDDAKTNIQAIQYYSDNHVSDHFSLGEKVTVVGKLDQALTSNYWYLPVYIDIQSVLPN